MEPRVYLKTPHFKLVPITDEDEDLLFDLDSDPEVMNYLTAGKPSTRDEVRAALGRIAGIHQKFPMRFGVFSALQTTDNQFMGWFLFRPDKEDPDNTKRIEVGYRLKKKYWGQGIATEGSLALLEKGFRELNVEEIFAVAMKKNLASQAVMKKIGLQFSHEFEFKEFPSDSKDAVMYSLTKEKWLQRHEK